MESEEEMEGEGGIGKHGSMDLGILMHEREILQLHFIK